QDSDSFYYTELSIGTPPQKINVLFATTSADIIVAGKPCTGGCPTADVKSYDHRISSSAKNLSTDGKTQTLGFGGDSITWFLFADSIGLGDLRVEGSTFLYGTALSSTLIPGQALSGSLGLAFAGISGLVQSSTRLFWQEALAGGSTDMSLYLARVLGTSNTQEKEPGGMITFGGIDTSLYSGDIEFLPLTGKSEAYWSLNVVSITVNGVTISAQASTRVAAFDMSSSILPGPPGDVARVWAAVPNSSPIQNQDGFYSFRKYLTNTIVLAEEFPSTACDSPPSISFSFGTKARSWPINLIDMGINPLNATHCVGAIFALFTQEGDSYFSNATTGSDRPSWIFGGTFLKNVYSVFRQDPPSIGFAELSTLA
ncbi:aspartic peptidase domain-containing protein, partial [Mycena amicta]